MGIVQRESQPFDRQDPGQILSAFVASQPFAVAVLDDGGYIRVANEPFHELTPPRCGGGGAGAADTRYVDWLARLEGAGCDGVRELAAKTVALVQREIPRFTAEACWGGDGDTRWYQVHGARLEIATRTYFVLTHVDHSEQRRALEAAKRSEEIFRLAMERAPIGMVLVALDGRFLQVNHALCRFWGYTESELLEQTLQSMTHPDDLSMSLDYLRGLRDGTLDSYQVEKRYVCKDGSVVWAQVSGTLVWDAPGSPRYFIAQIQDIQSHKIAEAKLRDSEERLQLALHSAELGTWDWDVASNAVRCDEGWAGMLGYRLEELDQSIATWEHLVHPDDIEHAISLLRQYLEQRSPAYEALMRMKHASGAWRWILSRGRVFERDRDGNALRVCGTHLDVTEMKHAREAIAKYTEELRRSNEELEDFAHVTSHDLKEPLRGIRNYASFLLEDYENVLDEDGREKLHTLTRLSDRLASFLDALLHYSRVGRTEAKFEPVNVSEQIANVLDTLHVWLQERNCTVVVDDDLPHVTGNGTQIGEVFRNLITNAAKYNDNEQRLVQIGHFLDGSNKPVYYVRDNGIGIEDKYHEEIFRIFRRLHPRDYYDGGTGAGLTIVKRIVERHGGCIWLESIPQVGSTFYVAFACEKSNASDERAPGRDVLDYGGYG